MLQITIPATPMWDEVNEEFLYPKEQTLSLEHSLVSLSKWESKYKKPFLTKEQKTYEETIDYIKMMTLTKNVDPTAYYRLTNKNLQDIYEYIDDPMTATTFGKDSSSRPSREQVTSELVYYWMIALQIPFECQKWHLNRLLTLIKVCNIKNAPPKKMSKSEIMRHNKALNEARKKKFNTTG